MKIVQWKQWYQVRSAEGFTVFQSTNRSEAEAFRASASPLPCADTHIGETLTSSRRGFVTKKISIYP